MTKIKTKMSHPSDLKNSIYKRTMESLEINDYFPVVKKMKTLNKELKISDEKCTYCTRDLESCEGNSSTDEIIPCKNGGRFLSNGNHINMTKCCQRCNRSKNGKFGEDLNEWIRNGSKNGESYVPEKNREKMIKWIEENKSKEYLCTNDRDVLNHLKKLGSYIDDFYHDIYKEADESHLNISKEWCGEHIRFYD